MSLDVRGTSLGLIAILLASFPLTASPAAQTAAFTYQGQLKQSGTAFNGTADLQFKLFDAAAAGNQIGAAQPVNAVSVVNGTFTITLDFGSLAFDGNERWLEIGVASPAAGGVGPFTTLAPRQKLTAAPYAAFALNALLPATYANAVNFNNAGNAFNGVFTGNGFGITSLNPLALSGLIDSSNIGGTYSNALALSNASNSFNGSFSGSGSSLSGLNASNIASGNLNVARLPTGGAWTIASNLNINSNALVVEQATGEVGVGTATPTATLEVTRSFTANFNPTVIVRQAGSGSTSEIRFQNASNNHFNLGITAANEFALGYNANVPLAGDLLRVTSTGSLGLGTISPAAKLHVNGDVRIDNTGSGYAQTIEAPNAFGDASIQLRSNPSGSQFIEFRDVGDAGYDAVVGISDGDENFTIAVNGAPRMTLTPTGRVGINTVAPAAILHVNGNARIDGTITVPATTRFANIPAAAFIPESSDITYSLAGGTMTGTTEGQIATFLAPICVPDGVTLQFVTVRIYDGSVTRDATLQAMSHPVASGGAVELASTSTSGGNWALNPYTASVSLNNLVVDNSADHLYLRISYTAFGGGGFIRIVGAVVQYQVMQPLP